MHAEDGLVQESVEAGRETETIDYGVTNGARIDRGDGRQLQVRVKGPSQLVHSVRCQRNLLEVCVCVCVCVCEGIVKQTVFMIAG